MLRVMKVMYRQVWQQVLPGAMDGCQGAQIWTEPPTSNLYNSIDT